MLAFACITMNLIRRRNMQRNFNWGSRNMATAAEYALSAARKRGDIGHTAEHDYRHRFSLFLVYLKGKGVKRLEKITAALVIEYGKKLAERVDTEGLSPSRAQTLVSAINSTLYFVTRGKWRTVSPTEDCLIPERCAIRDEPTVPSDVATTAIKHLRDIGLLRCAAVAELAHKFGLRAKEASLLDSVTALSEANAKGHITITKGTKGGRKRIVPVLSASQIEALERAAEIQGSGRSVMPKNRNWKQWLEGPLRKGRNQLHLFGIKGYHELRSSYAANRYEVILGVPAPANGGTIVDKSADKETRLQIASELGHGRIDVVSEYVGGRK